ncbi:hypothetical protein GIY21_12755 [Xanthomonas sontii]|uniref:Uncharacterized protein n=1 Tax=Xanthomonas sontii TaxID=2650745 RepID=A0A6N7QD99_9XANT|nr:hypothetical protein [Xanthomonas sontii]MRH01157.1 hypothetical protein [Xanthomonas sontii]MRH75406.1 hypothetical protein [Xanthomonas sontii]
MLRRNVAATRARPVASACSKLRNASPRLHCTRIRAVTIGRLPLTRRLRASAFRFAYLRKWL